MGAGDKTISDFSALAAFASADLFVVVDDTDSTTKKVTGTTLLAWLGLSFDLSTIASGSPLAVGFGGTGRATGTTAYGLIAAGTTATGAQQTLAAGATTEILVGGGTSALPVWTTATGTGAPVRAGSPTLTGTATLSDLTVTGTTTCASFTTDANYAFKKTGAGAAHLNLDLTGGAVWGVVAGSTEVYQQFTTRFNWYTNSAANIRTPTTAGAIPLGFINSVGSLSIGLTTVPNGGGTPVLSMANATNNPTGMTANTAGLVNKGGELYAWDASGNVTLISPHATDAPANHYVDGHPGCERMGKSENIYTGVIEWTNKVGETIEESYADYNQRLGLQNGDVGYLEVSDWDMSESIQVVQRNEEIKRARSLKIGIPEPYVKRSKPAWIK